MSCHCGKVKKQVLPMFAYGETDFKLCKVCGLVAREKFPTPLELDEIYRKAYERENVELQETNQESGKFALDSYLDFICQHMLQDGKKFLDYGAGTGALVERMRKINIDADGLEFSALARAYCKSVRNIELMSPSNELPQEQYAAVAMIEVIEHLVDLKGTLNKVCQSITPGGLLLVTTPNRKSLRAQIYRGHWKEAKKKFHLFLFDARALEFQLNEAGFELVKRIVFTPLQRPGLKFFIFARLTQILGLQGTLCFIVRRRI